MKLWNNRGHVVIEPETADELEALMKAEKRLGCSLRQFVGTQCDDARLAAIRDVINSVLHNMRLEGTL